MMPAISSVTRGTRIYDYLLEIPVDPDFLTSNQQYRYPRRAAVPRLAV